MEDVSALIVLTLLQLCRAETTSTEWFAANLISDPSYTPKPITEIFTTDLTFIPRNPTISTPSAPRQTQTPPPTISTTSTPLSPSTSTSSTQQVQTENTPQNVGTIQQTSQIMPQRVNIPTNSDIPSVILYYDPRQQTSQIFQRPLVTSPTPQLTQANTEEPKATPGITETTFTTPLPTTSVQSTTQEPTIVPAQMGNIQQTTSFPLVPPGFIAGRWNGRTIIPLSNIPIDNANLNSTVIVSSTQQPLRPANRNPLITVRVKSIKGSITNIHINPSTTKRPLTTRRRKSSKKRNDYQTCVNSCDGKKEPICSSPMGVLPVDPDRLKGFASLCHMACHNSFRKDQVYEKLADGRCGRLRTRIRPLDKNKLNREDLNKAQYTIVHNAPETIMEFSPLSR